MPCLSEVRGWKPAWRKSKKSPIPLSKTSYRSWKKFYTYLSRNTFWEKVFLCYYKCVNFEFLCIRRYKNKQVKAMGRIRSIVRGIF